MARPAYNGRIHTIRLSLRLREGQHDDLIRFFCAIPERGRAGAAIAAMRQGVPMAGRVAAINEAEIDDALEAMLFPPN